MACELASRIKKEAAFGLRMGLHSGPVYCSEDINQRLNVAGGGINIAQRVMDCGDAGHILMSHSVAETLQQLSQWRDAVHDLGEHEVKHSLRLRIYNLFNTDVGNPEVPRKTQPPAKSAESAENSAASSNDKTPSIAVLPFANMSRDPDDEYFSDGLAEEILNLLAKIPGLQVIARTSSFSFRGREQDIRSIAKALGVAPSWKAVCDAPGTASGSRHSLSKRRTVHICGRSDTTAT